MANDENNVPANAADMAEQAELEPPSERVAEAGQPGATANIANTEAVGFGSTGGYDPYVGTAAVTPPEILESELPSSERAGGDYLDDMGGVGSDTGRTGSG